MRSWKLLEFGEPSQQLLLTEDPEPSEPGPGDVIVDLTAVGLSFADVLKCRGGYGGNVAVPYVPGGESAGIVTSVGEDVEHLHIGDRVMVLGGGLRERVVVNGGSVFPIPSNLSFEGAAALPVNYGTAWFALHERAAIQPGETLLVTGAAGGTGSAAIQLGKAAGALVIAVAGGPNKVMHAKSVGADVAIDHTRHSSFADAVLTASEGGVDVAFDPVGGDMFKGVQACMGNGGRLLVVGFVSGVPLIATNTIQDNNHSLMGVHWGAAITRRPESLADHMEAVLRLAAAKTVRPLLYPSFPFTDAPMALQDLADRKTFGKVVVTVERPAPPPPPPPSDWSSESASPVFSPGSGNADEASTVSLES